MEETLGKRIVANRKRLGITQDRLAEQLGVTAQAVSKWENDQSCPDITMLPKLAGIFGISIDALLGCEQAKEEETVYESELVTTAPEDDPYQSDGLHCKKGLWEFRYDAGKLGSIAMALWVLLVGILMLTNSLLHWDVGMWDILWPSALLVFGIFGLFPHFSFFRLGCGIFGAYFLLSNLHVLTFDLGRELLLPVLILLFGISLLVDALHKPAKNNFSVHHNGRALTGKHQQQCTMEDEHFECAASFGENTYTIDLPRLSRGQADVSFGELTVDLSGCEEVGENCRVDANCAFGELNLLVPRRYRVEPNVSTSFAAMEVSGQPDPQPQGVIYLEASASFGEICIQYI